MCVSVLLSLLETLNSLSRAQPLIEPQPCHHDYNDLLHLQSIDLNDNTFTEEGAAAMATVLPSLQELRVVNFGDCLLRSGGARAVAGAIADGHQKLEVMSCFPEYSGTSE